jgi:hypothetical protein
VDPLKKIFERQSELHAQFSPIEEANGVGWAAITTRTGPLTHYSDLMNDVRVQYVVKDYLWRVAEELTEFDHAEGHDAALEELIDALHFFVELCILTGISDMDLARGCALTAIWEHASEENFSAGKLDSSILLDVFLALGAVGHTLRNRPWKQTAQDLRYDLYVTNMCNVFEAFVRLCVSRGHALDHCVAVYFGKAAINAERIERHE